MDGAVYILSLEVISRQIEILNCERALVGFAVSTQSIGLDLGEITNQGDSRRVEVPAHMEEPDRAGGGGLHPGTLTHHPDLQICRLELGTIRVPCLERFERRRATCGVDGVPQAYDGLPVEIIVAGRAPTRGESDPGAGVSRHGESMRPGGIWCSSAGCSESVGRHTPGNCREACTANKHR